MTAQEIAKLLGWKRGALRVRCPVHHSRGLTLRIYSDPDRVGLYCFAGCSKEDILATLGLTWKDTLYSDTSLTPEEKKAWAKRKRITELYEREKRMQDIRMMLSAKPTPRTKDQFEQDLEAFTRSVLC